MHTARFQKRCLQTLSLVAITLAEQIQKYGGRCRLRRTRTDQSEHPGFCLKETNPEMVRWRVKRGAAATRGHPE